MQPATTNPAPNAPYQDLSDEDVHRMYKIGDGSAYEFLYDKYFRVLIQRVICRHWHTPRILNDAEDIANESLMITLEKPTFKPQVPHPFQSYLYRVADNLANNIHRFQQRRGTHTSIDETDSEGRKPEYKDLKPLIDKILEDRQLGAAVDDCRRQLNTHQQAVLELRIFREMIFADIGQHLGTT